MNVGRRRIALLASAALALAALYWWRARPAGAPLGDTLEDLMSELKPGAWSPPSRAAPYLAAIAQAEDAYGIPRHLLARLLYQESRFRPEIVDGTVKSPAGAIGIAQFMPATAAAHGIDPADPWQAIPAAALELRTLHDRFGAWPDALAAYNWGQGNWNTYLRTGLGARGQARPQENVEYVAQIAGDVGLA